jgi:hypothetical protein
LGRDRAHKIIELVFLIEIERRRGRPLPQYSEENLEFCLEGKGYPIGLLLAAQGSDFIQALEGFGGKSAGQ